MVLQLRINYLPLILLLFFHPNSIFAQKSDSLKLDRNKNIDASPVELPPFEASSSIDIDFKARTSKILSSSMPVLLVLVAELLKDTSGFIKIENHFISKTCPNKVKAMRLSEKRALALINFLVANGINQKRFSYKAFACEQVFDPVRAKGKNRDENNYVIMVTSA